MKAKRTASNDQSNARRISFVDLTIDDGNGHEGARGTRQMEGGTTLASNPMPEVVKAKIEAWAKDIQAGHDNSDASFTISNPTSSFTNERGKKGIRKRPSQSI